MANETGNMISRAIQKVPEDPHDLRVFLKKVLRDHYQDIQTLFASCTDCDKVEQHRRENESS